MKALAIIHVEEAIELLRNQTLRAWMQYLTGAVPFLLALLWFLRDMATGYLIDRCAVEALVCTLTYFWFSAWKARFSTTLLNRMSAAGGVAAQGSFVRTFYLQSIVQTLKIFVLPFAVISVLPLVWTSSFFRAAAVEAGQPAATLSSVFKKSAQRSSWETRSNILGFGLVAIVFFIVLVNVFALVAGLPTLIRAFTGYEGDFTRYIYAMVSMNVLRVVLAATWLFIDPLLQAYAVIRCFHGEACTDGRDLLAKLRPAAAVIVLLLALHGTAVLAYQTAPTPLADNQFSRAVDEASKNPEYGWLRARKASKSDSGFFERLAEDINKIVDALRERINAFEKWLRNLLRRNAPDPVTANPTRAPDVSYLLYILAGIVLVAVVVVIIRSWRLSPPESLDSNAAPSSPKDLNSENILASDLPQDEWLRLAQELLARGETRLAVRAMYLSNLAYLGSLQLIRIGRAKSNSIYERELKLRPSATDACIPFNQSNRNFERIWYGFHEVTPDFVSEFQQKVEAIRAHAKA